MYKYKYTAYHTYGLYLHSYAQGNPVSTLEGRQPNCCKQTNKQ
jgi:hypothetical protein